MTIGRVDSVSSSCSNTPRVFSVVISPAALTLGDASPSYRSFTQLYGQNSEVDISNSDENSELVCCIARDEMIVPRDTCDVSGSKLGLLSLSRDLICGVDF